MMVRSKPLDLLTAEDVMNSDLLVFQEGTPLRDAARKLRNRNLSGAPVVDGAGKCVGVFSTGDLLRLADAQTGLANAMRPARPLSCSFQKPDPTSLEEHKKVLCILPAGACPIQVIEHGPNQPDKTVCNQPHCVLVDWQTVELEKLPADDVKRFMTADPVTVPPQTPLRDLAQMMIDAHIHRVIVVNNHKEPIGIVSATDLVAVIARAQCDGHTLKTADRESINWMY